MPQQFELGDCLGQGGFGVVYDAQMSSPSGLTRRVAVKLLRDPRKKSVARLRREGQLLALVHHPCVPDVVDIVTLGGHIALVTEYVPGIDLSDALRVSRPSRGATYALVARIADCLASAQQAVDPRSGESVGLVHRDIKPSNLRIEASGAVRLLDFGIAFAASESDDTRGTSVLGSVQYMAPERFGRHPVQPASDIYALGCVLAECLTGNSVHVDADIAAVAGLAASPGRHQQHMRDAVGVQDTELCLSMLAHNAEERPSAAEVATQASAHAKPEELHAWAASLQALPLSPGPLTGRTLTNGGDDTHVSLAGMDSMGVTATVGLTYATPPNRRWPIAAVVLGIGLGAVSWTGWTMWGPASADVSVPDASKTAQIEPSPAQSSVVLPLPQPEVAHVEPAQPEPMVAPPPNVQPMPAPTTQPVVQSTPVPTTEPVSSPPQPSTAPQQPALAVTEQQPTPLGTVVASGDVPFTLRANGATHPPGQLAVGRYRVVADFGQGPVDSELFVDVRADTAVTVRCNAVRWRCEIR